MKRLLFLRSLILCLLFVNGQADEIDLEVQSGLMIKMLRDMANQTAADSLNLPANASSIRENITDTFSCENRTYGYYADVDNDCQIFHVCLPSQSARGRNVTYRWSFICPNETIFNQEVLVCTRPEDSIDCKDSPEYYDLNKEIGKEPNKTRIVENAENDNNIESNIELINTKVDKTPPKDKKQQVFPSRNPMRPVKQNYIIQQLIKDIVDEEMKDKLQTVDFTQDIDEVFPVVSGVTDSDGIENKDRIVISDEIVDANEPDLNTYENEKEKEEMGDRMILERSMGRYLNRGAFRFIADV